MTRNARRWLKRSKRDMKKDDKAWEGRGGQISPEGLLNNWKRIAEKSKGRGWVTLTRSSNHPCETQSALLCLGNSVEFVVKVVNVNLGIPDQSPLRPTRTPCLLSRMNPFPDGGVHTRDAAAQMLDYVCKPSRCSYHAFHFPPFLSLSLSLFPHFKHMY